MRTSRVITAMTYPCARSFATGGLQILFALRALLLAAVAFVADGRCAAALPEGALPLDLPAGGAETTLKLLAAQARVEVVFSTEIAARVRTLPVKGIFTALDAAMRMLADTPLRATQRDAASAIVVSRRTPTRTAEDNGRGEKSSDPPRVGPPSSQTSELKTSTPTHTTAPNPMKKRTLLAALAGWLALSSTADAQTPAPTAGTTDSANKAVRLTPFMVSSERDEGYLAATTLAGSRLNTSLYDTPAAISVMTKDFLNDIGANNIAEAMQYGLNTEFDLSNGTGNAAASNDVVVSIRGIAGSTARNYFAWGLESDSYNVERLDFARGPNSILFGTGAPGGVINATTKRAMFGREINAVQFKVGSWDDYRGSFDVGRQVGNKAAVRLNGLYQDAKSWRDFVDLKRQGAALAVTLRPWRNTEIRLDTEYGKVVRVNAYPFLPGDLATQWIAAGRPISQTYGQAVAATTANGARNLVYDAESGTLLNWFGSRITAGPGFNDAMDNFSLVPLKANLSGRGNHYRNEYDSLALFVEQRIGPLSVELAASRQDQRRLWYSSIGFGESLVTFDPNARLPDGRPNPNVGRLYVQSSSFKQDLTRVTDDARLTVAYELDLTTRHRWLGKYQMAGLVSYRKNDQTSDRLTEVNASPSGTADYPADLTVGNNTLVRRTYLDPFGPGRTGAIPVNEAPITVPGVRASWERVGNQGVVTAEELGTSMIAGQARFIDDKLVVTGGIRRDRQRNSQGRATQLPVVRTWTLQSLDGVPGSVFSGQTKTFGGVAHLLPWLSAFYNKSDNFQPQSGLAFGGGELGPTRGSGDDYGIKMRLLKGRLYLSASHYTTDYLNSLSNPDGSVFNIVNEIYEALGDRTVLLSGADSIDTAGKGNEVELTANLTSQWRLTLNGSKTKGVQSNVQPRFRGYYAARREAWVRSGQTALIPPFAITTAGGIPATGADGGPTRISDVIRVMDNYIASQVGREGISRLQLREYQASLFTAYTFKADGWLKDLTAGAGVRYRGEPVIGYLGGQPVFGKDETYVNAMLAKNLPIFGKKTRLQANFENVLNVNDPIRVNGVTATSVRLQYPTPFRWTMTATVQF